MKALLAAIPVALWSFADSDNGFVPTGNSGQWEWGIPTSGPGGADPVWATRLTGDYFNDAVDELVVPVPDLTTVVDPVLTVRHWHRIQPGNLGTIEVDDGNGWVTVDPIFGYPGSGGFTGDSGGWIDTSVDLSMFGSTPTVRFRFLADSSVGDAGWYLSDVGVYDGDVTAPQVTPVLLPTDTEVIDQGYPVRLLVEGLRTPRTEVPSVQLAPAVAQRLGSSARVESISPATLAIDVSRKKTNK